MVTFRMNFIDEYIRTCGYFESPNYITCSYVPLVSNLILISIMVIVILIIKELKWGVGNKR